MKGLELISQAMRLEKTDRTPWVPFVGVHGAKLIGVNASEYLQSEKHIIAGVNKAIELYKPDGIPIAFDLQIEAEILGCKLNWTDDNPPAVISHPLNEGKAIQDFEIPEKTKGRIPLVLSAARQIKDTHPELALYGLITGPFTLALHLMGTDIFTKMLEDPEGMMELMDFTKKVAIQMSQYYLEAGCDVIAMVDPMTSQIDPMSFEMFVQPVATEIFEFIRKKGGLSSFFVCGHAQQNIEVMCKCKADNISIDENIPLDYVRDMALSNGISFGGNIKLTLSLLLGTERDSQLDALECIDTGANKGFILSPGCDLAMDTPVENLTAIATLVSDPYEREIVRTLANEDTDEELPDLTGYFKKDKVKVDVITLDSVSCAPCQYMVEAVRISAEEIGPDIEWKEYSIKTREGIQMMKALGVQKVPTICINGKAEFVSQIPPRHEIVKRMKEELRGRIE